MYFPIIEKRPFRMEQPYHIDPPQKMEYSPRNGQPQRM